VAELRAKQKADGSWALPALGTYKRRDGTDNDPAGPGDGYGSGLAVYVLRQAGGPAGDPAVAEGGGGVEGKQGESGPGVTRALHTDKAHYITRAGTAFAVLALASAGEPLAAR